MLNFRLLIIIICVLGLQLIADSPSSANGEKVLKEYYDNGKLKSESKNFPNGSMDNKFFFDGGQLQSETHVTKNFQNVHQKSYSKEGILLHEFIQIDGKQVKNEFYCNKVMEQVFVRWTPGNQDLSVKPLRILEDIYNLTNEEINILKKAGLSGNLEYHGFTGLSRECKPSRVVFVFQKMVQSPVELNLPKANSIIYIQRDNDWQKLPNDAPTLRRSIRFEPDKNNPKLIFESSECESGARQGSNIF